MPPLDPGLANEPIRARARTRMRLRAKVAVLSQAVGNHPFLVGLTGTIVATAMGGVTFLTLYGGRAETLKHADETLGNLALVLAKDLKSSVDGYDLAIRAMVEAAQNPATWQLPVELKQRLLFGRAMEIDYLAGAYVLDAEGKFLAAQAGSPVSSMGGFGRDDFIAHQRNSTAGLVISHPYRSQDGRSVVGLSRRISAEDGTFAGIALLELRSEYFQHLIEDVDVGKSGVVYIALDDGALLARKPIRELERTLNISNALSSPAPAASSLVSSPAASDDGVERLHEFALVPSTPMVTVVAPAVAEVLGDWRRRTIIAGTLTMAFGALLVLISWLFAFVLRDKVRAQADLAQLAAVDPLTNLSNRRTLEIRLAQEWQNAMHTGTSISVLFVDIDQFKLLNDQYGHATGDEVLAAVAKCIASVARSSVDIVARYGGEEFAVVLPGASAERAEKAAETVRAKVQAMRLANAQSTHGTVTVSVGWAACVPAEGVLASELLAAADRQMYAAKAAGRNRVKP